MSISRVPAVLGALLYSPQVVKELDRQYGQLLPPLGERLEGQAAPSVQEEVEVQVEVEVEMEVEVQPLDWPGVAVTQLLGERDGEGRPHGEVTAPSSLPCFVLLVLLGG